MPLSRLIEYLEQIATVLGASEDLHLIRIEKGSTRPVFVMPTPIANRARENAAEIRQGGGTIAQREAFNRIRRMVRRDAGAKPAALRDRRRVLLEFPSAAEEPLAIAGIRQATTIDGALVRLGGTGEQVTLQVQQLSGETLSGFVAAKSLAKDMAKRFFEPIRLSGIGIWERSEAGEWHLAKMQVQSFEPLEDDTLPNVVAQLRAAPVKWPDNADKLMRAERDGKI